MARNRRHSIFDMGRHLSGVREALPLAPDMAQIGVFLQAARENIYRSMRTPDPAQPWETLREASDRRLIGEALERSRMALQQWETIRAELRQQRLANIPTPAACERAKGLLISFLTDEQREVYQSAGYVPHQGSRGHHYQIRRGRSFNVTYTDSLGGAWALCAIPEGAHEMPTEDIMVAQLLALRADEGAFWRAANVHGPYAPDEVCFCSEGE